MDNIIFKNAGEPWKPEEDLQLNKLYNEDLLDIMEISEIHNRAPGGIISRLVKHNYITRRTNARGYITYKNSDLYKDIVSKNNKTPDVTEKKERGNKEVDDIFVCINKCNYIELKQDVMEMKNNIKELIEMMKSVYEFENI